MQTSKKKDAPRLARPAALYRKGRAPKGVADAHDSDSDYEDEEPQESEAIDVPIGTVVADEEDEEEGGDIVSRKIIDVKKAMNVTLRNVNVSKEGKVIVDGREESGRTIMEQVSEEDNSEEFKQQEEDTSSSEYESDSDDESIKPPTIFRPVFVPKRARVTIADREAESLETEEAIRRRELEAEERRKQSHDMVAESIKRELAEKETEEHIPDVDDTDGLDPEGEFEVWRLRELARIKRDKEAAIRLEEERAEIERRRALPEEVRLKEDLERAQKSREEKPKGQQKFLQKYWHKGAFHQGEEILKRHDYTGATESTVDVSLLPKIMQVRDFGKRSRTKYTHLVDQDTTVGSGGFGGVGPIKPVAGQGCFNCGGPHLKKDCPQLANQPPPGTGANRTTFTTEVRGEGRDDENTRTWRDRDRDQRQPRSRRQDGDGKGDYSGRRSYSRSHSRESEKRDRRRRSRSQSPPNRQKEKRRRVN